MSEIKRLKTLSASVDYVSLSEETLYKIAKRVDTIAKKYRKEIKIAIQTGDGEDEYISSNYNIFLSSEIPNYIKSVKIEFSAYDEDNFREPVIECFIKFDTTSDILLPRGVSEIKLKGSSSNEVIALYHDMKQILLEHKSRFSWFFWLTDNIFFSIAIVILTCLGFLYGLAFIMAIVSNNTGYLFFAYDGVEYEPTNIGLAAVWGIFALSIIFGSIAGIKVAALFNKSWSKVHFTGKLSDPNKNRRILFAGIASIIYAIALGVIGNVIYSSYFQ